MKQRLINHIQSITDPSLRKTCESILTFDKFFICPASLSFHHAYEGGLLAHTVEVVDIALGIYRMHGLQGAQQDFGVLIAAALWHDVLKIEEYERSETAAPGGIMWRHTDTYGKRIGHIITGAMEFKTEAIKNSVDRVTRDAIIHCILAHHGRREWGSPVEPQTLEALILHQSDMLSAHYGVTK